MRKRIVVCLLAALIWPTGGVCAFSYVLPTGMDPLKARRHADELMTRCRTWAEKTPQPYPHWEMPNEAFWATEHYRAAADQGDLPSMEALARIYAYGMTDQVKADPLRAAEWRRKAQEARQAASEGVKGEPLASPCPIAP